MLLLINQSGIGFVVVFFFLLLKIRHLIQKQIWWNREKNETCKSGLTKLSETKLMGLQIRPMRLANPEIRPNQAQWKQKLWACTIRNSLICPNHYQFTILTLDT